MNIVIDNTDLGVIEDDIVEKICEINKGRDISEIVIDYICRLVDGSDDMDHCELIKHANFKKNNYGYDTIADMVSSRMKADLRPANEICKNCDRYYNNLCLDILMEVDPFTKGNSCWRERQEIGNVTNIAEGYAKRDKEDDDLEASVKEEPPVKRQKEKVVPFRRPRWIVKEYADE